METFWNSINSIFSNPVYSKLIVIAIIILVTFLIIKIIRIIARHFQTRIMARLAKEEPGGISPIGTKVAMLRRIVDGIVYLLAVVAILFQFPAIRSISTTILATAGLLSVVIGMAAQSTFSNFIAGIAISFSQPVRLNDAVKYENEWGWVEEITLMHTVLRTWDNRRLIVPNSILSNTVVQNWTIKDAWLLGTVTIYVDYTCDVEQVRKWVQDIINESPYSTEERVAVVEVTDFTEKSMALRILGKSCDSSNAWNLRCEIREKLIKKFQEANLPLPQLRVDNRISNIGTAAGTN